MVTATHFGVIFFVCCLAFFFFGAFTEVALPVFEVDGVF